MKIRTDLSNGGRFTVWESGGWYEPKRFGNAILIAGTQGEKLPVVYDVNPSANVTQACFFAEQDQLVASAYLRPGTRPGTYNVNFGLHKISALETRMVQGHPVPVTHTTSLWIAVITVSVEDTENPNFLLNRLVEPGNDLAKIKQELLVTAFNKARTPPAEQRLFWAIPRNRTQEYDYMNRQ